jgi:hypothetical protein
MGSPVEIENIEELRRRAGIDDVELREAIRELRVGDCVRLTLLTGAKSSPGNTRLVRITRIQGMHFWGLLVERSRSTAKSRLHPRVRLAFTSAHIHSLAKERLTHGQ